MKNSDLLVVGADGLIGGRLFAALTRSGVRVTGTSRRKNRASSNCLFLDLTDSESLRVEAGRYSTAFLCAGIANMAVCEADAESSRNANVIGTVNLAKRLLALGTRTIFLSSNAVFDGNVLQPDEFAALCPSTEYGRQKVEAEQGLLRLPGSREHLAVVRLSKTLSGNSGIAAEFLARLSAGESCRAFDDLRISPVSLDYVTQSIVAIAASPLSGIFHLSGAEAVTYAEFARRLANHIGASESLVRSCVSADVGVKLPYKPANPGLGMTRTRELLQIEPEPTEHVLTCVTGRTR
jgi:dTDP-4-dehydrorhamnose reductase